jgi:hypothetical protein
MPDVHPGHFTHRLSNTISHELGSSSLNRGDVVSIGASGSVVGTTGSNGFLGVLQSATLNDSGSLGPGVEDDELLAADGDTVTVSMPGNAVRASVEAATGTGDELEAGSSGQFVAAAGARGDAIALEPADADGFAAVYLR